MNTEYTYALYINDPDHDNGKAVKFDTVEAAIKAAQDAVHDDPFYTYVEIMKLDARISDAWESYITIDSDGNAIADTDDAQRETGWAPYVLFVNGEETDYDTDMAEWYYDFDSALDDGCEALLEDEDARVRIMKFNRYLECMWDFYRDVDFHDVESYQKRKYKREKLGGEKKVTIQIAQEMMEENHGDLDLSGTDITALPDNLTVKGDLSLSYTDITALPDNLTVAGSLDLSGTSVTVLPDNLTVGGSLWLLSSSITSLPDNLTVSGCLSLFHSSITALPDNLTVTGNLDLSSTPIASLPDNLTVGGNLSLCRTSIKELPDSLKVGGRIYR